jgi:ABC-type Zn uptake system ZnuABC Zn-binding protein ZnuA
MNARKNPRLILVVLGFAALAVIALLVARPRTAPVETRDTVAVTTHQLADIARSVAGPGIAVVTILPAGANSHTFEPTPSALAAVAGAKAVYAIGHGFDPWIQTLLADAPIPVIVVDRGIALRPSATHIEDPAAEEEEGEEEHGPTDPHYWLDARNAATIAATIADDLSARFPARQAEIARNLEATRARLLAADEEIRRILSGLERRDIVTLHDAWYYFAEAYGLRVIGSFEPSAAKEPSPQYLALLSRAARDAGAKVIYKEPGIPTAGLEPFAADEGLRIVELDTLEGSSTDPYDAIMIRNAKIIEENQR